MNGKDCFDRFDFNDHDPVNQNVQSKFVLKLPVLVPNFNFRLPNDV